MTTTNNVDCNDGAETNRSGPADRRSILNHAGNKYLRIIHSAVTAGSVQVDVYAVLEAFQVTCPARQHALKKLLCAGLRGKGSQLQDLEEAINSCGPRILELQRVRELSNP